MPTVNSAIVAAAVAALSLTACSGTAEPGETVTVTKGATSETAEPKGSAQDGETARGGGPNKGRSESEKDSGGGTPHGESPSTPPAQPRAVDITEVAEALTEKGWMDCDSKPTVDMAGFKKVTCIIPDKYAMPGQDGNAVGLIEMDSFETAEAYTEYANDGAQFLDGIIIDGATAKAINGAVKDAGDLVQPFEGPEGPAPDPDWDALPTNPA